MILHCLAGTRFAEESSFRSDTWMIVAAAFVALLVIGALVAATTGLLKSRAVRGSALPEVLGWVSIAFSALTVLFLVGFPIWLFTVIALVIFAPLVALTTVISVVLGILSLAMSTPRA